MRCIIKLVTALALTSALMTPVLAQEKFVVGLVASMTGPFATVGEAMKRGAQLGVEMRGKVRGKSLELITEDDETKPQISVQKANKLLASGVNLMMGSVASGATIAIMKPIAQKKVPHLVSVSGSDDITGKDKTAYTFRTSDPNLLYINTTVSFVLDNKVKKLYALGLDLGTNRDAIEAITDDLKSKGVEIVGKDFVPLSSMDYAVVVDKVAKSGADAVFMYGGGDSGIAFIKQAAQVGLTEKMLVFGATLMNEVTANALGEVPGKVYTSVRYQFQIDNPANKAFVAAYRKKFNEWPSEEAGQTFDALNWYLDIVETSKSNNPEDWIKEFSASTYTKSIEGTKAMRLCDQQATKPGYWAVREKGTGDLPPYYLKLVKTYEANSIWKPCP
jgi:ABC-type branched-subunit amino acid transport system substrate-binding protein